MSKDRKAKTKSLGAIIGVSAAIAIGVITALSLSLGGAPSSEPESSIVYPTDMSHDAHGMEHMEAPPAP